MSNWTLLFIGQQRFSYNFPPLQTAWLRTQEHKVRYYKDGSFKVWVRPKKPKTGVEPK